MGYEALSRFPADDGGEALGPDVWFEAAHRLGIGDELEARALEVALAHRADLPRNCFLTINLDPNALDSQPVRRALADHGHLGGIVVEMTEHRRWDMEALAPAIRGLRTAGALLAVDDAGAGYSGLQQILALRPSILKLDRTLVSGLDRDEAKVALVEMLGRFAERIDAWILAEGIETRGELRRLVGLGVPLAQGFLLARPAPPWAGLDASARAFVDDFPLFDDAGLAALLDPVPPVRQGVDPVEAWTRADEGWLPVVDLDHRPVGLLTAESALSGELVRALVANVASAPAEVMRRIATAAEEPGAPVLVIDDTGRYLGLVGLRRLLHRAVEA